MEQGSQRDRTVMGNGFVSALGRQIVFDHGFGPCWAYTLGDGRDLKMDGLAAQLGVAIACDPLPGEDELELAQRYAGRLNTLYTPEPCYRWDYGPAGHLWDFGGGVLTEEDGPE